jgi:hypothetical protein
MKNETINNKVDEEMSWPKPGWLAHQLRRVAITTAISPKYLREGFNDDMLTPEMRREAARLLRERADELERGLTDSPAL